MIFITKLQHFQIVEFIQVMGLKKKTNDKQ